MGVLRHNLIFAFLLLALTACGGGGGNEAQIDNGDEQQAGNWDQFSWDKGVWR